MKIFSALLLLLASTLFGGNAHASDPRFHSYTTTTSLSAVGTTGPGGTLSLNATVTAQSGGGFGVTRVNNDGSQTGIGGIVTFYKGATQLGQIRIAPSNTAAIGNVPWVDPGCVLAGASPCTFYYLYAATTTLSWPYAIPLGTTGTLAFSATFSGDDTFSQGSSGSANVTVGAAATLKPVPANNIVSTGTGTYNVLIPATATTGPAGYAWNAPGFTQLDLQGKINNGNWNTPVPIAGSGNNGDNVPLGSTYNYRILPRGGSTVLASFSITGVAAPAPTFSATPTHVIVPLGQTTGPFGFQWNAPGYLSLDLQGSINGGAWTSPVNIPTSGTNGSNIPVGDTWRYRFLPHGDTTHVLGTITITASH